MLRLKNTPSPRGTNTMRMVTATLPPGLTLDAAQAALNRVFRTPEVHDASPRFVRRQRRLTRDDVSSLSAYHPPGEEQSRLDKAVFELSELLVTLAPEPAQREQAENLLSAIHDLAVASPKKSVLQEEQEEGEAEDEAEEESAERIAQRFHAALAALERAGYTQDGIASFKQAWVNRYGSLPDLPANALETGRIGGALASDAARRRTAERWPDAGRLAGDSAIETRFGERSAPSRSGTSKETLSRWGDVAGRIGHA